MSIEVQDLTKIYGEQLAVDHINFRVNKGEVVGLLGPNGAGKSTTMKMLTCYTAPTSGSAKVGGQDILSHSLEVRKKIGYLPENNPLYKEMYVREYLSFIAGMFALPNATKRIDEMIDLTGLGNEREKKIGALSKGYRQRVGLAQALIHNPEVLILDEPTTGLDPNQIVEIRNVIRESGKEKTVILSSHIMQEVQAVCDRVIIINKGIIVADEATEKLVNRVSGREYLRVKFKNNVPQEVLKTIKGVMEVKQSGEYWLLSGGGKRNFGETVFNFAVEQNNPLLEMVKEGESLEKVFQQLTQ